MKGSGVTCDVVWHPLTKWGVPQSILKPIKAVLPPLGEEQMKNRCGCDTLTYPPIS